MDYDSVRQWFDGLGTRSEVTKKAYLDDLILYCEWSKKTPDQLKQERKVQLKSDDEDVRRTAEKLLNRYANSDARAPSSIRRAVESLKSFYHYNFIELKGVKAPAIVREKDYRCPTVEDVRKMLEGSNLRDRAIFLTLFQTGLREGTLVLLKLKHIKEMSEDKVPAHIGLRSQELKGTYSGLEAHTFLGKDAIDAIKKYLNWRKDVKGERLTDDSFLFTRLDALGQPLDAGTILQAVAQACKRAGIDHFSPHDFRRAFQTNLEAAGVPVNWTKKMMGHTLSGEENPYSIPKIEQLREAYARAEPKLTVTLELAPSPQVEREEKIKRRIAELAQEKGKPLRDIIAELQMFDPKLTIVHFGRSGKPIGIKYATEEEEKAAEESWRILDEEQEEKDERDEKAREKMLDAFEKSLREYEKHQLKQEIIQELSQQGIIKKGDKKTKTDTDGDGHYESKIVLENELTQYLDSGWEFVASLNHEKYLVRRALD